MSITHEYQGILDAHRREMDRCLEEFDEAYDRQMKRFQEVIKTAEATAKKDPTRVATDSTEPGYITQPPSSPRQPRRGKIRSIRIDR